MTPQERRERRIYNKAYDAGVKAAADLCEKRLRVAREQCAQIAETFDLDGVLTDETLPKGWAGCRRCIAEAIRQSNRDNRRK